MKRPLEDDEGESPAREGKRALSFPKAVIEVVRQQSTQEFFARFEPFLRRVVREEVERLLQLYTSCPSRFHQKDVEASHSRRWQLHFKSRLPSTLFTGSRIETEGGSPIQIVIMDTYSKRTVTSGPLSSIKVEILVLNGDFGRDEEEDWSAEDFDANIIREREGKRPLLMGELKITLKDGVGNLGDVSFTDNSSWIKSRTFRVGARIIKGSSSEERIREARTEAFVVKDHRGESYKKHYPPSLDDEIWRLEKIGKDGVYHKRLSDGGIRTVQDFLRFYVIDHVLLRTKFCSGMSNKSWEATVQHARTCHLDKKFYMYEKSKVQLLLNSIYEVVGVVFEGVYQTLDYLSSDQLDFVLYLKQCAYKNQNDIHLIDAFSSATLPKPLFAVNYASAPQLSLNLQYQDGRTTKEDLNYLVNQPRPDLAVSRTQLDDMAAMPVFSPYESWGFPPGNSLNSRNLFEEPQESFGHNWVQTLNWSGSFNESGDHTGSGCISSVPGLSVQIPRKPNRGWLKLKTAVKWGISLRKHVAGSRMASPLQWGY